MALAEDGGSTLNHTTMLDNAQTSHLTQLHHADDIREWMRNEMQERKALNHHMVNPSISTFYNHNYLHLVHFAILSKRGSI